MSDGDRASESGQRNGRGEISGEAPEEFQQFEDLARKLIRVPKAEVDAKREKAKPSPSAPRR